MTDFGDNCFGCGGHLRGNVHSGNLCPPCEAKHQTGKITAFGQQVIPWVEEELLVEVEHLGPGRIAA